MSNDQRPKKMAVYSGNAAKVPPPAAAARAGAAGGGPGDSADAGGATVAAEGVDGQPGPALAASGLGLPIWAVLLFLVIGTAAGGAAVALIPRFAAQLIPNA